MCVGVLPQNPWFRKSRFKGGKGKKMNIGGGGLGYRERPGLGADSGVSLPQRPSSCVAAAAHTQTDPELRGLSALLQPERRRFTLRAFSRRFYHPK